jgi:hypothetical protein
MLVQERDGSVRIGFATPRAWLAPGKRIAVERMPTRAGPVSFAMVASERDVSGEIRAPKGTHVFLRLRLPGKARIASVLVGGTAIRSWSARTGTIDLGRRSGAFTVRVAR